MEIRKKFPGVLLTLEPEEVEVLGSDSVARGTLYGNDGRIHRAWKRGDNGSVHMRVRPWQFDRIQRAALLEEAAELHFFPMEKVGFRQPTARPPRVG